MLEHVGTFRSEESDCSKAPKLRHFNFRRAIDSSPKTLTALLKFVIFGVKFDVFSAFYT